jgi:hypothetical protein
VFFTVVIQRSVRTSVTPYADLMPPDFLRLVTSADGSLGRSYWRVTSLAEPAFLVGYRGERGAEVALAEWNRESGEYAVVSTTRLDYGAEAELPKFQPVMLGGDEVFLARLSQDNGWQAVYLIGVHDGNLSVSVESVRPDGSGQPFVIGSGDGRCRGMRVGDVDGDGNSFEILVTETEVGGGSTYQAYRWQGGRLIRDEALARTVERSDGLFAAFPGLCEERQGIYLDELSQEGEKTDTRFIPAESVPQPDRSSLFEEMEIE